MHSVNACIVPSTRSKQIPTRKLNRDLTHQKDPPSIFTSDLQSFLRAQYHICEGKSDSQRALHLHALQVELEKAIDLIWDSLCEESMYRYWYLNIRRWSTGINIATICIANLVKEGFAELTPMSLAGMQSESLLPVFESALDRLYSLQQQSAIDSKGAPNILIVQSCLENGLSPDMKCWSFAWVHDFFGVDRSNEGQNVWKNFLQMTLIYMCVHGDQPSCDLVHRMLELASTFLQLGARLEVNMRASYYIKGSSKLSEITAEVHLSARYIISKLCSAAASSSQGIARQICGDNVCPSSRIDAVWHASFVNRLEGPEREFFIEFTDEQQTVLMLAFESYLLREMDDRLRATPLSRGKKAFSDSDPRFLDTLHEALCTSRHADARTNDLFPHFDVFIR